MIDYKQLETEIDAALRDMGLTLKYVCIDSGDWRTESKWQVIISKGKLSYSTEFTKGCGHRIFKLIKLGLWDGVRRLRKFKNNERIPCIYGRPDYDTRKHLAATDPEPPYLTKVMHCLVSDANCAYGDFEEFCSDLDCDSDSIKTLEMYNACRKTRRELQKMGLDLDNLSELFQDY